MLRICSLIALILPCLASAGDLSGATRVVDGDTLGIATPGGEAMIRLHGIDAPERDQTCRAGDGTVRACGQLARDALTGLIGTAQVRCTPLDMDRHDRIVARCRASGRDLGAEMVAQGMAVAYVRYSADYLAGETAARRARLGIWAGQAETPESHRRSRRGAWQGGGAAGGRTGPVGIHLAAADVPGRGAKADCAIKGNVTGAGRIYHVPGGPHYERTRIDPRAGERWFCSAAQAEAAGWRPVRGQGGADRSGMSEQQPTRQGRLYHE